MSVIVKDLNVVLHDLEPATRYEFKVRTVKDGLTSPFSDVVTAWTIDESESSETSVPSNTVCQLLSLVQIAAVGKISVSCFENQTVQT